MIGANHDKDLVKWSTWARHLGGPSSQLAIAVAAAMIIYVIHTLRKKDEPDPLYGGVSGTVKEEWARTGNIDFHVVALDSTSPQQFILRIEGRKRLWKIRWGRR